MTRLTTIGGVGQNVFALFKPLRYLGFAITRCVYDIPIKTHFAIANVNEAAFERVKQDESDNRGEIYFRAMRSRPTRPTAGNRDVGLPPQGKGVWLELIKHLKGSDTLTTYRGSLTLLAEPMEKRK